jgi:protein involved in polysaccharide export with SLBB domain
MFCPRVTLRRHQLTAVFAALGALTLAPSVMSGQNSASLLTSRAELTAAAEEAETRAATGDASARTRNSLLAAAIRQRLSDGDFQPGDRVIVTIVSGASHTDTVAVRAGRILELPGKITLPLTGVLRSELEGRAYTEVLKYVKAAHVTVTPLTRIGVLGEVSHPGYFALASDVPLTDAIMAAGGPTVTADVERTIIRRGSQEFRSSDETRQAVARGLTLDQFGLRAGDELVVGKKRNLFGGQFLGLVGALASLSAVFVALSQ